MPNYDLIIQWCDIAILIAYFMLLLTVWYYVAYFILSFKKTKILPKGKNKYKYCILIPARNEDKVIKNILNSLKKQTYNKDLFTVWVIIESKDDPTFRIVKEMGYNVFIRENLKYRQTKGFALQECMKHINDIHADNFDSYMIFDADNVLEPEYIDKMNDLKNQGNMVGFGYRNFTNANKNFFTECSALLFSMMNSAISKGRSIIFKKILLSGTGYFIDKIIIDNIGEWIFTGMTEDVQLTTYCTYHNIKMGYYDKAEYFDEEPEHFKDMHKQHLRWIWGFFKSRKPFKKKEPDYKSNGKAVSKLCKIEYNFTIIPVIAYLVLVIIVFLIDAGLMFSSIYFDITKTGWLFWHTLIPFSSFYFLFFITALLTVINDNKRIHLSFWHAFRAVFLYTFFFLDFISAFFDGLFHPRKIRTWFTIQHRGCISNKEALRSSNEKRVEK